MLIKHKILVGLTLSMILLVIATWYYPGGSYFDPHSIGFEWGKNYLCNLFDAEAVNGASNGSRPWAIAGILVLCVSFALFFMEFSKKIPPKSGAGIIKYAGSSAAFLAFFAATPFHNLAVGLSGTLALLSMFYITVLLFKSRRHWLKVYSVACMLLWYACNFVYYTQIGLEFLPVLQKVLLGSTIVWILVLQYFTSSRDFQPKVKSAPQP